MPDMVLGIEDTVVNKTKSLCPRRAYILVMRNILVCQKAVSVIGKKKNR